MDCTSPEMIDSLDDNKSTNKEPGIKDEGLKQDRKIESQDDNLLNILEEKLLIKDVKIDRPDAFPKVP